MSKRKAFTLVELLVVISIIALLMAILMPSLTKVRAAAQKIVCASHMKDLALGNEVYANQWDGYYLPCFDGSNEGPEGTTVTPGGIGGPGIWMSNTDFREIIGYEGAKTKTDDEGDTYTTIMPAQFSCPSNRVARKGDVGYTKTLASYGYNMTEWDGDQREDYYKMSAADMTDPIVSRYYYWGHQIAKIRRPSQKLSFVDSVEWLSKWPSANYFDGWDKEGHKNNDHYNDIGNDNLGVSNLYFEGPTIYRHAEGTNIAFYDGHVAYMKKAKVWINKSDEDTREKQGWAATPKYSDMWVADEDVIVDDNKYLTKP